MSILFRRSCSDDPSYAYRSIALSLGKVCLKMKFAIDWFRRHRSMANVAEPRVREGTLSGSNLRKGSLQLLCSDDVVSCEMRNYHPLKGASRKWRNGRFWKGLLGPLAMRFMRGVEGHAHAQPPPAPSLSSPSAHSRDQRQIKTSPLRISDTRDGLSPKLRSHLFVDAFIVQGHSEPQPTRSNKAGPSTSGQVT